MGWTGVNVFFVLSGFLFIGHYSGIILLLVALVYTLLIAQIGYEVLEAPFLNLKNRLTVDRSQQVVSGQPTT